ncbi:MAG: flagellar hook capping FlgD N-terminal domain-containing protein [Pseudomonadota bacterium]
MELDKVAPQTPASQPVVQQGESVRGQAASDFETFLSLLTAQLQNQDPLKPIDSTEFVAQLAQFSSVEQQVATNETLGEVLAALRGEEAASLGQWIGREVETQAAFRFEDDPVALTTIPDAEATSAVLVATNLDGALVSRQPVDPSASAISWTGRMLDGRDAPEGFYRFTVERFSGDRPLPDDLPRGYARVSEIRMADGAPSLVLESGDVRDPGDVTALRAASD